MAKHEKFKVGDRVILKWRSSWGDESEYTGRIIEKAPDGTMKVSRSKRQAIVIVAADGSIPGWGNGSKIELAES